MGSLCCCADAESIRVFILDWRCFGISSNVHQINEEIRDSEIRLISATGEQLGIMSAAQAQHIADEQGRLPVWHLWGNETDCMVGNPGIVAVADAS